MKTFLRKHLDDVLILAGAGLVVYATWVLSWVAALYVAGALLIAAGVLIGIGTSPQPSPKGKGAEGEKKGRSE